MTILQVTRVSASISSFFGSNSATSTWMPSNSTQPRVSYIQAKPIIICELENDTTAMVSRRCIALGTALTAIPGLQYVGEAKAARRKPAAEEKKPEEKEDKNISAVQAKLIASNKRKAAMKEAVEKQRARAKSIDNSTVEPPKPLTASVPKNSLTPAQVQETSTPDEQETKVPSPEGSSAPLALEPTLP